MCTYAKPISSLERAFFPLTFVTLQLSFQYQTSWVPWTEAGSAVQNPCIFGWEHGAAPCFSGLEKPAGTMGVETKKQKMAKAVEKKRPDKRTFVFSESSAHAVLINSFVRVADTPSPVKGCVGRFSWRFAVKFQEKPWPKPQPRQSVAWTAPRIVMN